MRTIGLIALTLCMGGCSPRAVPVETPIATAYSDGFEVIVCEPDAAAGRAKVRSLPLEQAEAEIAKGASGLIKGDPKQAESDLRSNQGVEVASVNVTSLGDNKQRVLYSLHYGSRTFAYQYLVDGARVTPEKSEYRDLAKSRAVLYQDKRQN
ncbi:hypothetical protein LBMAG47_27410 [Planctomycetia bacterium]|jgi:hypothetical protein|nr:hypothetical protein LBMAG47_27410 [Planctomycetia bacterium]